MIPGTDNGLRQRLAALRVDPPDNGFEESLRERLAEASVEVASGGKVVALRRWRGRKFGVGGGLLAVAAIFFASGAAALVGTGVWQPFASARPAAPAKPTPAEITHAPEISVHTVRPRDVVRPQNSVEPPRAEPQTNTQELPHKPVLELPRVKPNLSNAGRPQAARIEPKAVAAPRVPKLEPQLNPTRTETRAQITMPRLRPTLERRQSSAQSGAALRRNPDRGRLDRHLRRGAEINGPGRGRRDVEMHRSAPSRDRRRLERSDSQRRLRERNVQPRRGR